MRLSVIVPVYNAMPFLVDAIRSITSQTYSSIKLIAVDDCSADGSLSYLKSLTDERLVVIAQSIRQGQGAARNRALLECDSEYTAFMDADDVSLPTRFAQQIEFLDKNPQVDLVGTRVSYMGKSGKTGFSPPLALTHDDIRNDLLNQKNALVNSSLMFRTKLLQKLGGYRIDGAGEDWDLFLRATEIGRCANLGEVLYLYRVHDSSTNAVSFGTPRI